jgi:protein TonB
MDFARQQRDPARHVIGITLVVVMHALLIYALLTGLGRTVVEVIKKPLTATIIEEIKAPPPPPPPPPPKRLVEAPKVQAPEPYVPPPDIPVPQTAEPVISAPTTTTPPPEPYVVAPPPPVVEAPPPKPAIRKGITPIKREDPVYPRAAMRLGIEKGRVVARLAIDEKGNVTNVTIVSADPPKHFDKAVIDALMEWKFSAEGAKYIGEIEVNFTLQ